ncbi:MAG: TAT-variant-translocated molybdopterin oxidoreductase [Candidatus Zixiibacteriota bacterium]
MIKKTENNGRKYWRSLQEAAVSPEYRKRLKERYEADYHADRLSGMTRRNFLTLMGASMALASVAGCRRPVEKIIPYVTQPEEIIPGVPQYYATTMPFGNNAVGLLVQSREGRPIKIEGNPKHPSSLGATDFLTQASILGLYDPNRSKKVRHNGMEDSFDNFVSFWREKLAAFTANRGEGLAVLSETFASPTLARYKEDFEKTFPSALWATYEPISDENIFKAYKNVTGQSIRPLYRFERAEIILAVDSDFLQHESESVVAMRGFSDGRRVVSPEDKMNRLYVAESNFSVTGGMADHRLRIKSAEGGLLLVALAIELKKLGLTMESVPETLPADFDPRWVRALAKDLYDTRGRSLIVAGRRQPVEVHELALALNQALGNVGQTMTLKRLLDTTVSDREKLMLLTARMNGGHINTLIIFGGNPLYNTPADFPFAKAFEKVTHTVHLSAYVEETSRKVTWHIPRAHYLESWGDARAADGTLSVVQPMIEPLFGAHADIEMLALLTTGRDMRGYDIVRETWQNLLRSGDFEKQWRRVLHDGFRMDSASPDINFTPRKNIGEIFKSFENYTVDKTQLEINFYSSNLFDGRYANNGWLQELPDAVTKLAWDNAALVSVATAERLELKNNELVKLEFDGRELELPVWVCPGNADGTVAVALGYGRTDYGKIAAGVGFNAYTLCTSAAPFTGTGVKITKTGKFYELANVQDHNTMEGRPIIREATLDEYRANPVFAEEMVAHPPLRSIYPDHDYRKGYQWGMVIDLNVCTGCNACTIACQSENNIQIVGKEQVARGREMHWIRTDRYFVGDVDDPQMVHQPVPCQQCENAPCEQVCPVAATVHDSEGLNTMAYNRCIGTRYCSNNCPYKVRRFNFFNYVNKLTEVEKMAQNPDVTMRFRGVMEKCTFCLQRIKAAKSNAKLAGRTVVDGEFQTACEQACPAKAIRFGNLNDAESEVSKMKKYDRNYELLAELNVRPRNSYLAKLRNPNSELLKKTNEEG